MQTIDQYSKAAVEFTLTWDETAISHHEKYWADPVSFWRDVLDPELLRGLLGKGVGGQAAVDIAAERFVQPYDPKKLVKIRPEQFKGSDSYGNSIALNEGRFYPQQLLSGIVGVFRVSTAPCRYLGRDDGKLVFDLNHPLASYDLRLQAEIRAIHGPKKERGGRCEYWLERISADGPGMQSRVQGMEKILLNRESFQRLDERPDSDFYRQPRMVHHLDSEARSEIGRQYGSLIPPGARVLDLMGSWTSHLPEDMPLADLTILGMNEAEMRQNIRATATVVHDLNQGNMLPFADGAFEAVICTASVEYLTRPLAVLAEIKRVLRPGGLLAIAFSNRWFPPKVVRIWSTLHEFERLGLATDLFLATGGFREITTLSRRGVPRPTDDPHQELLFSDPLYMAWAYRA